MARKFNEFELDEYDADDYGRGRKLNKNAHRAERRARDTSRYAFDNSNDASYREDREYSHY